MGYHAGGPVKHDVIATWADYKKAGPLLVSLEHRGTNNGQPAHINNGNSKPVHNGNTYNNGNHDTGHHIDNGNQKPVYNGGNQNHTFDDVLPERFNIGHAHSIIETFH